MPPRAILLGPDGQLGRDVRRAHAETRDDIDLVPIARATLELTAPGAVERVLGDLDFDVLVNCAAYTAVDEAEDHAALVHSVNADSVRTMARVCAGKRARLVHVSTDYVFGADTTRNRPLREHDPMAPVNVYGASKAKGETLACLESDDVVILRVASLFGAAGAGGRGGNFVETMVRAGAERQTLRVVADQTMSPTAAADAARVVIRMLAHGCEPGVYHVVNTGSATWFEFAREIVRRAGGTATLVPCATEDRPARAARPSYSALDNTRAAAAFGAMPSWQDALGRYLRAKGYGT